MNKDSTHLWNLCAEGVATKSYLCESCNIFKIEIFKNVGFLQPPVVYYMDNILISDLLTCKDAKLFNLLR